MRIATPFIQHVIEVNDDEITSVVIENQILFRDFLEGVYCTIEGGDESFVFSDRGRNLKPQNDVELIGSFVPFEFNSKSLVTAVIKHIEKVALEPVQIVETNKMLEGIKKYIKRLTLDVPYEMSCDGLTVGTLLKASGLSFDNDEKPLGVQLVDYMRLVRDFCKKKIFVLVQPRSFFTDVEMEEFIKVCTLERFFVLCIESVSRTSLALENRLIVDRDLCELTQRDDNLV